MTRYTIETENECVKRTEMEFFHLNIKPRREGAAPHIHDLVELLLITKGSFKISCDGSTVHATEGDLVLFRSNSIHITHSEDAEENGYWVLKIAPRLLINFLPKDKATDSLLWLSVNHKDNKFLWKREELAESEVIEGFQKLAKEYKSDDQNAELAMRIAAATVILGLLRQRESDGEQALENSGMTELIYQAIVYVNNNYHLPITAEEVSRELNVSYSYFSRSFKRIMGTSFRQHLNAVRINNGESLLKNTDYSVSKISELCGFESVSHFISTYRKLKNNSPLQARKEQ